MSHDQNLVICIIGKKQHGKDTVRKMFQILEPRFQSFELADGIKKIATDILMVPWVSIHGTEEQRNKPLEYWINPYTGKAFTGRTLMQFLGTDLFRRYFHIDVWPMIIGQKIKQFPGHLFIVADNRYSNESLVLEKKYSFDVVRIKVVRSNAPSSGDDHVSEKGVDSLDWDYKLSRKTGELELLFGDVVRLFEETIKPRFAEFFKKEISNDGRNENRNSNAGV